MFSEKLKNTKIKRLLLKREGIQKIEKHIKKLKGNEATSIYCKETNKSVDYLFHLLLCNKQLLNLSD